MVERNVADIFGTNFFQNMGFVQSNTENNKISSQSKCFNKFRKPIFGPYSQFFFFKKFNCCAKLRMGSYGHAKTLKKNNIKIQ